MKKSDVGRKSLFAVMFWQIINQYKRIVVEMGKVQGARAYVQVVSGLHRTAVLMIWSVICIGLVMTGFVFLHIALILVCDWTNPQIALFLLICGIVYCGGATGVLIYFMSGKRWSRSFKVDDVVRKATRRE